MFFGPFSSFCFMHSTFSKIIREKRPPQTRISDFDVELQFIGKEVGFAAVMFQYLNLEHGFRTIIFVGGESRI